MKAVEMLEDVWARAIVLEREPATQFNLRSFAVTYDWFRGRELLVLWLFLSDLLPNTDIDCGSVFHESGCS